jgi:hypothetical protein
MSIGKSIAQCFHDSPYKSVKHSTYFPAYEKLFSSYVGREFTFLEIGIFNGGSLFMWRDYFGPKARIIGVDLNPVALKWVDYGFDIRIGSQSDTNFWKNLFLEIGPVDIVLDDGGHTFEQQIVTSECCIPNIKNGGLLVVEDTHTSYFRDFGGPCDTSFMNYSKNFLDGINYRCKSFKDRFCCSDQVYSMRFFESIVVFEIDRELCKIESEHLSNGGETMDAKDFRFEDSVLVNRVESIAARFSDALENTPVVGKLGNRLSVNANKLSKMYFSWLHNRKLKKYFRY